MPDSTCQWHGCAEALTSTGAPKKWCDSHRRARAAEYTRTHVSKSTCTEDDCDRPVKGRGMCSMHYRRWERANGKAQPPSDAWSPRRRAQWKKRHAEKRGAPRGEIIYPESIYRRDGWICRVCGEPVDRTLEWPHVMSASLDHRVPIAAGGTHTRDNVQLAHFACNARKGKRLPESLSATG